MKQVATWSRHGAKVNHLLLFGEHILSVDVEGNIFTWAFKEIDKNLSAVGHVILEDNFNPSCIMHPDTYLNKVSDFLCSTLYFFRTMLSRKLSTH